MLKCSVPSLATFRRFLLLSGQTTTRGVHRGRGRTCCSHGQRRRDSSFGTWGRTPSLPRWLACGSASALPTAKTSSSCCAPWSPCGLSSATGRSSAAHRGCSSSNHSCHRRDIPHHFVHLSRQSAPPPTPPPRIAHLSLITILRPAWHPDCCSREAGRGRTPPAQALMRLLASVSSW